jgi:schlafen family protein
MMDYLGWCEHVLSAYFEGAQGSLEVRRDGLRPDQVARSIFGSEVVEQEGFGESVRWEALTQAIQDLDDEGLILTDDDYYGDEPTTPGKITDKGEEYLANAAKRWSMWWATGVTAPHFKPEQRELFELVNRLSPREGESYAWMEWIHQDTLCRELGWDLELVRVIVQEIRSHHNYILTRPNFYPLAPPPRVDLHVRANYNGLVLATKRLPTKEDREIDELVEGWETKSVEFKRELKTTTKDQKAEFVKDVLGLANTQASRERWLIVGFDDKTHTYHSGCTLPSSQDDLERVLAAYTDPVVDIRYDVVEHYQGPVGRIRVLHEPKNLPYTVAKSIGEKKLGDKKRIEKGQVFVRHGSQTEEPTPTELEALRAEGQRARR